MSRPAAAKRYRRGTDLSEYEAECLCKDLYSFDDFEIDYKTKWEQNKKEILQKWMTFKPFEIAGYKCNYNKPGTRPFGWWVFEKGASGNWLGWSENVPLAERREYRKRGDKILSNIGHLKVL